MKEVDRGIFANSQHQAGELASAEKLFQEAEAMQGKRQPEYRYLYSLRGFLFCDLLLAQGKVREVLERYKKFVEWRLPGDSLLSRALEELSAGRAYLLEAVEKVTVTSQVTVTFQTAADYLNQALTGLRESGRNDIVPLGLFARAFCYRLQNQFPQAWGDLAEAHEIAERGDMKLWLVDYHLEAARIVNCQLRIDNCQLFENGREVKLTKEQMMGRLKNHVEQAEKLVQETGYHRRDPEVELGYAGLFLVQGEQDKAREHLAGGKKLLDKMGIRCWDFYVEQLSGLVVKLILVIGSL